MHGYPTIVLKYKLTGAVKNEMAKSALSLVTMSTSTFCSTHITPMSFFLNYHHHANLGLFNMPHSFTQPNTQTPKILTQLVDIRPISMLPGLSVSLSKVILASSGYHKYHAHLVQNSKVC